MATIKDIASLAEVSPTTVSRFLNGQITVREETRRRIEEAVRGLNYKPNYLARSLVLKETKTVGVVIPDILNPYFPGLTRGVEDEAQRAGWSVVLCNSDNKIDKELSYLQMLQYKHVDGIILVSSGQPPEQLLRLLDQKVNLVLAGRRIEGVQTDTVAIANTKGAYEATRYLISLGHCRIAIIRGSALVGTSRERLEGYYQALSEAGIAVEERWVSDGGFQYHGGFLAMKRFLEHTPRPTAVFAVNDLMAIGAINAVQAEGGAVPEDVAVVGFDGIPLGELIRPRLTTMSVSPYKIGETACRLLLDRVARKGNAAPRLVIAEAQLEIRESCCAPQAEAAGAIGSQHHNW